MTLRDSTHQQLAEQLSNLPQTDLSLEDLCQVLSENRRRQLIIILDQTCFGPAANTAALSFDQLTEHVTAVETAASLEDLSSDKYQTIQISLYHHHLWVLEQNNLIEWDGGLDDIHPTEQLPIVATLLRVLRHHTNSPEATR